MAPAAGLEAGCVELRCECVVAVVDRESAWMLQSQEYAMLQALTACQRPFVRTARL